MVTNGLVCLLLLIGQMISGAAKPVVRLAPGHSGIPASFGGHLLELIHSPATISLPKTPPSQDGDGAPWSLDVKNLGPAAATVTWNTRFSVKIDVGQTAHILSNGSGYSLMH